MKVKLQRIILHVRLVFRIGTHTIIVMITLYSGTDSIILVKKNCRMGIIIYRYQLIVTNIIYLFSKNSSQALSTDFHILKLGILI